MRPGLTGPAQVAQVSTFKATAELEAEYAQTASVSFDVRLLLRTVWILAVGKRRGAKRLKPTVTLAKPERLLE